MDPVLASIADSLAMDDIPVKLRCAACNKLALNAFRTPCCDQSICETCQSSLPQACPICLHEPVKGEDCRPNKTLRMTIKAFLKKLMTEKEKAQKKQAADKAATTPAAVQPPVPNERPPSTVSETTNKAQPAHQNDAPQNLQEDSSMPPSADTAKLSTAGEALPTEAQKDVPQPSIETTEDHVREDSFQEQARGEAAASDQTNARNDGQQQSQNQQNTQMQGPGQQWSTTNGVGQGISGGGLGFEGMNNGFPNMAFANPGDFSTMMQFMPNNAMSGLPNMMGMSGMPGMPGMGMDAMQAMSQSMFGGFGGPGMGVNGMNAGMGFPAGQGWNGGFNGQPGSWMSGQDKFNQNAYGGHANGMGGDFGANAGYAGYNMPAHQGNYNQMNHHQFPNHDFQNGYHGQGFHNRGRGRGRGYSYSSRGRGGYNQVMSGHQTNHEPFHHQYPQQSVHPDVSYSQNSQQPQEAENQLVDEFGRDKTKHAKAEEATDEQIAREMAPGDADESPEATAAAPSEEAKVSTDVSGGPQKNSGQDTEPQPDSNEHDADNERRIDDQQEQTKPAPIETFISDEQSQEQSATPTSAITGNSMMPPPTPSIPQPSQPSQAELSHDYSARGRGLSRGLPRGPSDTRGIGRGRGSAHLPDEITNHIRHSSQSGPAPIFPPIEPKGLGVEGAPKGPKAMREGLPNTGIRGGRGFSIVGRASSAAHGRPNGHARSRRLTPILADLLLVLVPLLDTDLITVALTVTAPPAYQTPANMSASVNAAVNAAVNATAAVPTSTTTQTKRKNPALPPPIAPHTEVVGIAPKIEMKTDTAPIVARTVPDASASANTTGNPVPHANAHAHHLLPKKAPTTAARRERDHDREDEDPDQQRRERKRSRRDYTDDTHPSTMSEKRPSSSSSLRNAESQQSSRHHHHRQHSTSGTNSNTKASAIPTKDADLPIDPHEVERQARNKERMQKELQRREAMEGKGGTGRKSGGGGGGSGGAGLGRR
ncbi:MAG: hypothetical protein Q9216_006487, partial [Gyalolechia sp. 2 TL-2023]